MCLRISIYRSERKFIQQGFYKTVNPYYKNPDSMSSDSVVRYKHNHRRLPSDGKGCGRPKKNVRSKRMYVVEECVYRRNECAKSKERV